MASVQMPHLLLMLATLAVCGVALAWHRLETAPRDTPWARRAQRLRLRLSRLGRMLVARQVGERAYQRIVPFAELREQLERCDACPHEALCDTALRDAPAAASRYSFCPNHDDIERYRRRMRPPLTPRP